MGTPTVYVTASRDWLVEGYIEALGRFREASARDSETAKETFWPLFEALNWVHSIRDFEDERGERMDDPVSRALRFVRNRVHHRWAAAIEVRRFPTTLSAKRPAAIPPVVQWCWKATNELPPGGNRQGEAEYDELLAGKPVQESFERFAALIH